MSAGATGRLLARALARGQRVLDREFDDVFPLDARGASRVHWTPVEVAVRAARLLVSEEPPDAPRDAPVTILDVGSGAGKFCIIAAAVAGARARVRGVEQRGHLVEIARAAAARVGVAVDLVHGTLTGEDPSAVDGVYLFNPFAENLSAARDRLDHTVELSEERFGRDVAEAERFLHATRPGTRVVTYSGFGGSMPAEYTLTLREHHGSSLELWIKGGAGRG